MPTARPRYQVTETATVARALDRAAERWPGEPRSKLLVRLVHAGSEALSHEAAEDAARHHHAVLASSGAYAEAFGPHFLDDLRSDWPE